jgi:ABC-type Na+ efflux pump permease subunit
MLHRLFGKRVLMKATALYRTASILLIVAAAGNTYAVVRFWQAGGATNGLPLPEDHRLSYGPVVLALGVFCSLGVLFAAYLAWHLGALARTTPQAIGALGWALFAYQILGVFVSFNELSGVVRILTVALAIWTGLAAWMSGSHRSASRVG